MLKRVARGFLASALVFIGAVALLVSAVLLLMSVVGLAPMTKGSLGEFLTLVYALCAFAIFIVISMLASTAPFNGKFLAEGSSPGRGKFKWLYTTIPFGRFRGLNQNISMIPILWFCLGGAAMGLFTHVYLKRYFAPIVVSNISMVEAVAAPTAVPQGKAGYASYFFRPNRAEKLDIVMQKYRDESEGQVDTYKNLQASAAAHFQGIRASTAAIEVVGYTDASGKLEMNQRLSERRAATVRSMLVGAGVPPSIVSTRGAGVAEAPCLVDNFDKLHRDNCLRLDRRVDVYVYQSARSTSESH